MKKILPVILSVLLLTSCGEVLVAQVGDIKLTPSEYGFYLNSIKTQMLDTELQTDADWETQEIEGKKAIDVAKERAMDIAVKNMLYIEALTARGIVLDVNEKMTIDRLKSQLISGYGGMEGYNAYLKENDLSDKFIETLLESAAYQSKLHDLIKENEPATEEEIMAYYEQNKSEFETRYRKAKHILILTTEQDSKIPLVKSEQEKAKRKAESIFDRAIAGEDFDALMYEFSQDPGLLESPDGYVFTTGEMVPEFEAEVDSLFVGEIGFCESDYGYHIVKKLPLAYEDIKEFVEKDFYEERVDAQAYEWAEEYGVEIIKFEENYKEIK